VGRVAHKFGSFERARIEDDLGEAFRGACRTAGIGPSEALRGLIAAWVTEAKTDEDRVHRGPAESDRRGRPVGAS
jgi:hypothetical protein